MTATATAYSVREAHGYVWVARNGQAPFPQFAADGFAFVRPLEYEVQAPLELVLDNFTEVEHAASVHTHVGYDLHDMHKVTSEVRPGASCVRVENSGPQKRIPLAVRLLFGISSRAQFHWEWTTHFSPVYAVYDEFWTDRQTSRPQGTRARIAVFFCPIDEDMTRLVVFASFRLPYAEPVNRICLMFKEIARQMVDHEIRQDAAMIENLAEKNVDIQDLKLSRFDRPLPLHRERLARVYRGESG